MNPNSTPHANLLGIDLGTSSVKVLLTTADGNIIASGSAEYPILHPQPDRAEQDPEDWWSATLAAARQALKDEAGARRVVAVGLSGQMHGTVLLGKDHRLLAPAVIWPDRRSGAEVQEITATVGRKRLIQLTGSPVATGFQAATLRWFQRHEPKLWRQVRHILLPKDYLRWRLTGEFATDPSDGSGSLLLDARHRQWSGALLDILEIDRTHLPPVQPATTVAGRLTPAAASALGLPVGIGVVTGAADTAASALGAGIVERDTLLLTLSSGGQLVLPVDTLRVDPRGRIHTFCSALEPGAGHALWYQMGAILSAGLALRWLRDQIFALDAKDAYARMIGWAEQAPAGANGLLFLPYLSGERTPHMDPAARGIFLGLTAQHGRPELVRAVLEGVTLACYDAYQVLLELGADSQSVILAGGGARNRFWQQIVADVFDLPVRALQVTEQSALGAALLAGAGAGSFDLVSTAKAWSRHGDPILPNIEHRERYRQLLDTFRNAYQQNQEIFHRLANMESEE